MEMDKIICPNCSKKVEKSELCGLCSFELILNERYYLLNVLGQNIGVTYEAFDEKIKKNVVIKELSMKKLKSWKDEELFKREGDILMSLNHSQIPDFIDYFEIQIGKRIKYYTVMEFIEGESLVSLATSNHFSETRVISLIKEVSLLLSYLHDLTPAVIHRDIKPSNIIKRKKDGKYVLIDFDSVVNSLKPGGDSTVAGTFGYMAPEQFMGKASKKSDYYSLGVIALELITKKKVSEFMKGVKLNWTSAKISKNMRTILNALLAENPEDRIGSFKELIAILDDKSESKIGEISRSSPVYLLPSELSVLEKTNAIDMYQKLYKILDEKNVIHRPSNYNLLIFIIICVLTFLSLSESSYFIFLVGVIVMNLISSFRKKEDSKKALTELFTKITEKEAAIIAIILKRHDEQRVNEKKYNYLCQENIRNGKFNKELLDKYTDLYRFSDVLEEALNSKDL
jgi:serine/threonine protein kinase